MKHLNYRKRVARTNAQRPFLAALSAVLLAAEFVFMQELCGIALDTDNAAVVTVVSLGATATTPILMVLAARCLSDYAAVGGREKAALGVVAIVADVTFVAIATWFRFDSETAQAAATSQDGSTSLLSQVSSSLDSLSSPAAMTALMTGILVCSAIACFISAFSSRDAVLTRREMDARRALPRSEGEAFAAACRAWKETVGDHRLDDRYEKVAALASATIALAAAESLFELVKDPADSVVVSAALEELPDGTRELGRYVNVKGE